MRIKSNALLDLIAARLAHEQAVGCCRAQQILHGHPARLHKHMGSADAIPFEHIAWNFLAHAHCDGFVHWTRYGRMDC